MSSPSYVADGNHLGLGHFRVAPNPVGKADRGWSGGDKLLGKLVRQQVYMEQITLVLQLHQDLETLTQLP